MGILRWFVRSNVTILRWVIASTVIGITLLLTMRGAGISSGWEAVFLAVVGYYFKDRPEEEQYKAEGREGQSIEVIQETTYQFALALLLVVGTFAAFAFPHFKPTIPGAWVGAVVLALGFYFKDIGIPKVEGRHDAFRAILATTLTLLTLPLLWIISRSGTPFEVPFQWVGVVFIVITFYFKEKRVRPRQGHDLIDDTTKPASEPE